MYANYIPVPLPDRAMYPLKLPHTEKASISEPTLIAK